MYVYMDEEIYELQYSIVYAVDFLIVWRSIVVSLLIKWLWVALYNLWYLVAVRNNL